ncbi:hypothetical protein QEZ52_08230 [Aliisedimentitalea scapharcae]|uniref:Uncharacterized protein n=1 Tax=Aliisedimentitalea scapharcae TaxID=1524259 RepID=A0ABZ2XWN4_9RHOB
MVSLWARELVVHSYAKPDRLWPVVAGFSRRYHMQPVLGAFAG